MNGKDICNLLKQYRKELSEKNEIDYEIKDCSHGDGCKGTCSFCEKETEELYTLLREKENNGETVDWTTSVKLPVKSIVLDTDKCADSDFEIGDVVNEHITNVLCDDEFRTKGLFDPNVINVDYLKPLQGELPGDFSPIFNITKGEILNVDVNDDNIFPDDNCSHMNELMGDVGYEPDYPETPYGEMCEFFSSFETSESESDKDEKCL